MPLPAAPGMQGPTSTASAAQAPRRLRAPSASPSRFSWMGMATGATLWQHQQPPWASCGRRVRGCLLPPCLPPHRPSRLTQALRRPVVLAGSQRGRGMPARKKRPLHPSLLALLLAQWWAHWVSGGRWVEACTLLMAPTGLSGICLWPSPLQPLAPLPSWRYVPAGAGCAGLPQLLAARCCLMRRSSRGASPCWQDTATQADQALPPNTSRHLVALPSLRCRRRMQAGEERPKTCTGSCVQDHIQLPCWAPSTSIHLALSTPLLPTCSLHSLAADPLLSVISSSLVASGMTADGQGASEGHAGGSMQRWRVRWDDVRLGRARGRGSFGRVSSEGSDLRCTGGMLRC